MEMLSDLVWSKTNASLNAVLHHLNTNINVIIIVIRKKKNMEEALKY